MTDDDRPTSSEPQDRTAARSPALVIVCNSIPPYRVHLHRRVAREIPELKLWTLITHENRGDRWGYHPSDEIGPVLFGPGEETSQQGALRYAVHEWRKGGRIIRWMEQRNIRAVVLCGYNDLARVRILLWCSRRALPSFIFGDANVLIERPWFLKKLVKHCVVRPLLRIATGVLVCGRNGQAFYQKFGVPKEKINWFPYEPNFDEIRSLDSTFIERVREEYSLQPHRRRIVFSGRLIDWKRADMVIDAFTRIASERPEWDLIIIGDGPLRENLEGRVPPHLRPRVRFTGFITQQTKISALYRMSDVLAHPANNEQWALVVQEAAAAGLALVVADTVGSAIELVRDGINGRRFRTDDLADLVHALRDVTSADRINEMKAASAQALWQWRQIYDPVNGLRLALFPSKQLKIA